MFFLLQITQTISPFVRSQVSNGSQCYLTTSRFLFFFWVFLFSYRSMQLHLLIVFVHSFFSSVSGIFPQVSFNFAGGASMILRPEDYLLQQNSVVSRNFILQICFILQSLLLCIKIYCTWKEARFLQYLISEELMIIVTFRKRATVNKIVLPFIYLQVYDLFNSKPNLVFKHCLFP